jgi:putative alpha-1,2-mannosidase
LYAFSNEPQKGQKYIHRVISEFHNNTPDGMIGNDDCGQMSAWYILSTLGFYPVNPASGEFVLGSPQLKKATIHISNNKQFNVQTKSFTKQNIITNHRFLNNTRLKNPFISYQDIMKGGILTFEMTTK